MQPCVPECETFPHLQIDDELHTSAETFAAWLMKETAYKTQLAQTSISFDERGVGFPTAAKPARSILHSVDEVLVIDVWLFPWEKGSDYQSNTPQCIYRAIEFDPVPIDSNRVEVHANCFLPEAEFYFVGLLLRMVDTWPEAENARSLVISLYGDELCWPEADGAVSDFEAKSEREQPITVDASEQQARSKKTIPIDADVPTFITWLALRIGNARLRKFPAVRGYFTLNEIPSPWPTTPPVPTITFIEIAGRRVIQMDDREKSAELDMPWLIRFNVVRLNDKRTEVTAECREPAVMVFFDELLEAMARNWPQRGTADAATSDMVLELRKEIRQSQSSHMMTFEEMGYQRPVVPQPTSVGLAPGNFDKMKQQLTTKQRLWIAKAYWFVLMFLLIGVACLLGAEVSSWLGVESARTFLAVQIVGNTALGIVLLVVGIILGTLLVVLRVVAEILDVTLMVWKPDKWRMITRGSAPAPIETPPQPEQVYGTLRPNHRAKLRQNLEEHFSKEELRTLCFDLGIKYENFPEALDGMAREIVAYCERTGHIPELLAYCLKLRPKVSWSEG